MTDFDPTLVAKEIAPVLRKFVSDAMRPIEEKIAALEARAPTPGKDGRDGVGILSGIKRDDGVFVLTLTDGRMVETVRDGRDGAAGKDGLHGKDGSDGVDGKDGRDGDAGRDGADGVAGKDGAPGIDGKNGADGLNGKDGSDGLPGKDGLDGADGAPGRDGVDGKDADEDAIVERVFSRLMESKEEFRGEPGPAGRDGADGRDGVDGKPGEPGMIGKEGPAGRDGKDGKDGKDGLSGRDGKDGAAGRDGKDGLGFNDFRFETDFDGERTVTLRWFNGPTEHVREMLLPIVIDRGVFKQGATYQKGDGVTFGGSFFIAQRETGEKPETTDAWRLAVKRGRDGKDGQMKAPPPTGPVKV